MERAGVGKTTKITVKTETLTIIRRAKAAVAWCPDCCADVEVITLGADTLAESIVNSRLRTWLASGRLHFWQQANGSAQLCLPSLLRCFELEEVRKVSALGEPSRSKEEEKK